MRAKTAADFKEPSGARPDDAVPTVRRRARSRRAEHGRMATILDDEDTVEAQALSTSLDPYGQLVKMLMPRALLHRHLRSHAACRCGCPTAATAPTCCSSSKKRSTLRSSDSTDPDERDGFARSWDGDTAYVFILRDGATCSARSACRARTAAAARDRSRSCRDCCDRRCRCSVASSSTSTASAICART